LPRSRKARRKLNTLPIVAAWFDEEPPGGAAISLLRQIFSIVS
jgi:hypothetical protein